MNHEEHRHASDNGASPRRLYRDRERGMLAGVCAGIADYFGFRLCATRWIAVISCLIAPITLLIYIGLAFLLPTKPRELYRDAREEKFWRSVRKSPSATFSEVKHKFREMEAKLQRLERYVTSSRFGIDREFEELERE